jgi:hypothetical protein
MTTPAVGRGPALVGFALGFVMTFVATVLALMLTVFESLERVLVPGAALLSPLSETMADWHGLATMVLTGIVNGLVYAVVLVAVVAVVRAVRRG